MSTSAGHAVRVVTGRGHESDVEGVARSSEFANILLSIVGSDVVRARSCVRLTPPLVDITLPPLVDPFKFMNQSCMYGH